MFVVLFFSGVVRSTFLSLVLLIPKKRIISFFTLEKGPTVSAWLGFAANVAGIAGGLACGAVAVYIPRKYKLFIILLYLAAGTVFVLFNLMLLQIVPKGFCVMLELVSCIVGYF
jgi:hypothetical protein